MILVMSRNSFLLTTFLIIFSFQTSFAAKGNPRPSYLPKTHYQTPYFAPLQQSAVLFVEDPGDVQFGPMARPDPLWDAILTAIFDTGNFGWYGPIETYTEDGPGLDTLLQYDLVIWNTYDYWWPDTGALTETDQNVLASYLEMGGKVWLIGQDLLFSGVDATWMSDYFHLADANQDYASRVDSILIQGLAEIASSSFFTTADYQLNLFFPDELIPDAAAHGVLEDTDSNKVVGIFYSGTDWMSSFWTIEGRDTSSYNDWLGMVSAMFDAFGIVGINEVTIDQVVRALELNVVPDVVVEAAVITYSVPATSEVSLQIFDEVGREVCSLVEGYRKVGAYRLTWNGRDNQGVQVSNGVYFARLMCDNTFVTRKFILVR